MTRIPNICCIYFKKGLCNKDHSTCSEVLLDSYSCKAKVPFPKPPPPPPPPTPRQKDCYIIFKTPAVGTTCMDRLPVKATNGLKNVKIGSLMRWYTEDYIYKIKYIDIPEQPNCIAMEDLSGKEFFLDIQNGHVYNKK